MQHITFNCRNKLNNIINYSLTQLFIKYFTNLQLSATCFGFLVPEDGSKKPKHVTESCKFIKYFIKK